MRTYISDQIIARSLRWLGRIAFVILLTSSPSLAAQSREAGPEHDSTTAVSLTSAAAEEARRLAAQGTIPVERRRNDSVLNGAIIGAAAGVASGLAICRLTEPWDVCNDPGPLVRFGAVGAGIGIAIDALIRRNETVYIPAGNTQLHVAPVVRRGAKGLQVAVRF